ncbi:MAG: hypothetical protein E4H44_04590, partial [Candidatus Aminicenantes bacterium]
MDAKDLRETETLMSSNFQPRCSLAAILGAVFLPPLVVRALLLVEGRLSLRGADLSGVVADLGVSLVLGSVAAATVRTHRWFRPVATVLVAGWCAVNFANYEHIRELGSMANLSHASYVLDPVFFRGSALAATHPVLLIVTMLTSTISAWCALGP